MSESTPPLVYEIKAKYKRARASVLTLRHGPILTPVFMPVGTKGIMIFFNIYLNKIGTIKGLTSEQVSSEPLDAQIILGNTYHLSSHPGSDKIAEFGGLHKFMNWPRNLLTDSGGFQMVSLLDLAEITEEGVKFRNPNDGKEMLLTPEESIRCQVY